MSKHIISSAIDHTILYGGVFETFMECLEQAILDKIDLSGADLSNRNLSNACLDDAILTHANFSGSNLTGTNLSESNLTGAIFKHVDLYNTCFAYTCLNSCDFQGAMFGATDITAADISFSSFSTLSCFTLDFMAAQKMEHCRFINERGQGFLMSRPPVIVRGLEKQIMVFTETAWMTEGNITSFEKQFHPISFLAEKLKTLG